MANLPVGARRDSQQAEATAQSPRSRGVRRRLAEAALGEATVEDLVLGREERQVQEERSAQRMRAVVRDVDWPVQDDDEASQDEVVELLASSRFKTAAVTP